MLKENGMSDDQNEHSGLHKLVDRAQDMVGAAVGMTSAATAGSTNAEAYVMNAAISDMFEIASDPRTDLTTSEEAAREGADALYWRS